MTTLAHILLLFVTAGTSPPMPPEYGQGALLLATTHQIRHHHIDNIESKIAHLPMDSVKDILWDYVRYLKSGYKPETISHECLVPKNPELSSFIYLFYHFDLHHQVGLYDEQAYTMLSEMLHVIPLHFSGALADLLQTETLRRLLYNQRILARKNLDMVALMKEHIALYERLAQDSVEMYYTNVFKASLRMHEQDLANTQHQDTEIERYFERAAQYAANHPYLLAGLRQAQGIYEEVFLQDYTTSLLHFEEAKHLLCAIPYTYAQQQLPAIHNSLAILLFKEGRYKKAAELFQSVLSEDVIKQNPPALVLVNEWLFKCYDSLNDYQQSLHYLKEFQASTNLLDKNKYAAFISKIHDAHDFAEKEQKLLAAQSRLESFMKALVFGLLLACILAVVFYRKYSASLSKIPWLTHRFVMINGEKFYCSTLMFIETDDHFLKLYRSDKTNCSRVRESLSQIMETLPPNFIRVHRSFVVNRNFVKQLFYNRIVLTKGHEIPIGRKYKSDIDVKKASPLSIIYSSAKSILQGSKKVA